MLEIELEKLVFRDILRRNIQNPYAIPKGLSMRLRILDSGPEKGRIR